MGIQTSSQTRRLVGLVGSAKRFHPDQLPEAERDLRASQLEDHVRRVVASAPPLTVEQRQRIAAILNGGAA